MRVQPSATPKGKGGGAEFVICFLVAVVFNLSLHVKKYKKFNLHISFTCFVFVCRNLGPSLLDIAPVSPCQSRKREGERHQISFFRLSAGL